jgi:hypothetical protein
VQKNKEENIYFLRVAPLQLTTHNTTLTLPNARCFNTRKTAVFEEAGSVFYCLGNIFTRKQTTIYHSTAQNLFSYVLILRTSTVLELVNVLCRILHPRAVNIVQETHQSYFTHQLGMGLRSQLAAVLRKFCIWNLYDRCIRPRSFSKNAKPIGFSDSPCY